MNSEKVLRKYFDKIFTEIDFVRETYNALKKFGFTADNTIACSDVCRDEISQPIVSLIKDKWGEAFNLSGLAAMFFAGRTALLAAMHHAPIVGGKERYIYYAFPHIAIGSRGKIGVCKRRGREEDSLACGALNAFLKEMNGGKINLSMDNEDIEQSLLKMRLLKEIPYGHIPNLLELTKIVQKIIQVDLENALKPIINTKKCDYALVTGIQIHAPDSNYVWPVDFYAVVNGKKQEIKID